MTTSIVMAANPGRALDEVRTRNERTRTNCTIEQKNAKGRSSRPSVQPVCFPNDEGW
jgi:hypothetical protein